MKITKRSMLMGLLVLITSLGRCSQTDNTATHGADSGTVDVLTDWLDANDRGNNSEVLPSDGVPLVDCNSDYSDCFIDGGSDDVLESNDEEEGTCTPQCEDKQCGPDGCGGSCGVCKPCALCDDGQCVGTCLPDGFGEHALRVSEVRIGSGGHPGHALDVDGDGSTCAPSTDCEGALDNELSAMMQTTHSEDAINQWFNAKYHMSDSILLEFGLGFNISCQPFRMSVYAAAPIGTRDDCDWSTEWCDYCVTGLFDPSNGEPLFYFEHATICDGLLTSGQCSSESMTIPLRLGETAYCGIRVFLPQIAGRVSLVGKPEHLEVSALILAGGVIPDDLVELLQIAFEYGIDMTQAELESMIGTIETVLQPDLPVTNGGNQQSSTHAVSFGLQAAAVPATILGAGWECPAVIDRCMRSMLGPPQGDPVAPQNWFRPLEDPVEVPPAKRSRRSLTTR